MGNRLYVGNLSYNTTEEDLRDAFAQDGRNVTNVQIVMDRETGRPRGFAFVEMASQQEADAAIKAWNGQMLDGRSLKVNEAQERSGGGRGPRGGGRYENRGGGGRGGGGGDFSERDFSDRGYGDSGDRRGGGGRGRR